MKPTTAKKYRALKNILGNWQNCAVAYSGGCDSSLLLHVATEVLGPKNVLALTARSPSFPDHELDLARRGGAALGVEHVEFDTDELSDPDFVSNQPDRCYHCKRDLFSKALEIAKERGLGIVADASNRDDAEYDYRPGLKALEQLGIMSPLRDARLGKTEIRELSKHLGLPTHDRPSFACLASRFPYGERITAAKLDRVGAAESIMRRAGFSQFRVRSHGDLARIELGAGEDHELLLGKKGETIVGRLKKLGYIYVALDLEGYRSGSMNEAIGEKSIPADIHS